MLVLTALTALLLAGCGGEGPVAAPPTEGWRTEVWGGVAIDVPPGWEWGTAPIELSGPALCGVHEADRPYVGRPIADSDVCATVDQLGTPTAPYVWLGAPLEPGVEDLGSGWRRETVEAEGATVTVASDDAGLRRAVLESARPQEECGATVDDASPPGSVCVYGPVGEAYDVALVYATTLPGPDAAAFVRAVGEAPAVAGECDAIPEYVVVTVPSGDRFLVDAGCGQVRLPGGRVVDLTDAARAPWTRDGVPAVLRTLIGALG